MKKTFLIIQMLICAIVCFAQKEVTILVSGEGKTKTEATDAALRSAIEQTFGAFVSTNTTILNDELVKDEIATVSSGNIEKYTEVNYFERNGKSYITLNATISIGKLVSYAKSKGSSCELDGATFTAEIRKLNFYRENTIKALENLREQLKVLALDVFDVQLSKPNITASGEVSVTVEIYSNENMYKYEQLILTTLKQLAIPETEIKHLDEIDAYYTSVTCMPLSIKTYPNGKNEIWLDKDHTKKFYLYTFFNPESPDGKFNQFRENIFTDVLRNIKIVDNLGYKLYAESDSFFNPYDYKND
ncbi:MAG: hypothetical protein K5860_01035, partial [Bacteroidales bacterium]|nr:hypothetical protein [Bacteroidales bacterium]